VPGVVKRPDLRRNGLEVIRVLLEDHVMGAAGVERRIKVYKVNRLVRDTALENLKVVAEPKAICLALRRHEQIVNKL
jgi:hypothetical protein